MSDLPARLAARIRRDGPISVADYMAAALTDPDGGYYTGRDPLGAAGDFTTAPEISQMFGELIAAWCIDRWHSMGNPAPFALAELGPGRGTLMADLLRTARLDPAFLAAARVHLVEASPVLRDAQRCALGETPVTWLSHAGNLPELPLLLVANEFFDALPIHQFVRSPEGWRERLIGFSAGTKPPKFEFVLSAPCDPAPLPPAGNAADDAIAETCPQGRALAETLGRHVAEHGGAALIIDYGYADGHGDTLQAVRAHRYADVLENPGSADITAHVDFAALAACARDAGAVPFGVVTQGEFLHTMGIEARAVALSASATPAQRTDIESALRRLIAPGEMGTLFKVLAITDHRQSRPAGFAA